MKKALLVSSIIGALSAPASFAQEYSDFEAYVGGARYLWDGDRNLDNSSSVEAGIEIPLDEQLALEAWFSSFEAEGADTGAESDGEKYSLGALYHLAGGDLRPFISLGGSHQEFESESGSKADESLAYLGLGAKKYFDNNFVLRGELLAMNSIDNEVTDVGIRVALGYAFGRTAAKPVIAADPRPIQQVEPAPVKQAEPKPAVAETKEEPMKETTKPAPEKAAKPEVVEVLDQDLDGIPDDVDQCPKTDQAFKVDETGCAVVLVETVSLDIDVKFKSNSATISGNEAEVSKLADFLKKFPETSATVEGYTDSRGSDAYNNRLSQQRADAVKNTLISNYGIAATRLTAIGYGEINPIATNDTPEGREANRRVVARVSANYERNELK